MSEAFPYENELLDILKKYKRYLVDKLKHYIKEARGLEEDELINICYLEAKPLCERYQPNRGMSFRSYLFNYLFSRVCCRLYWDYPRDHIRKPWFKSNNYKLSLNTDIKELIHYDSFEELNNTSTELLKDEVRLDEEIDTKRYLEKIRKILQKSNITSSYKNLDILFFKHFVDGYSYKEIEKEYGLTSIQQQIIFTRIKKILKKKFVNKYENCYI